MIRYVSVEPGAIFGNPYGVLAVRGEDNANRVTIEHADEVIYVPRTWIDDQVAKGRVAWAELHRTQPWTMGATLFIHGTDRTITYMITGATGSRVPTYLCEQP